MILYKLSMPYDTLNIFWSQHGRISLSPLPYCNYVCHRSLLQDSGIFDAKAFGAFKRG